MDDIIERARRFGAERIRPRDDLNRKGHFPRDLWKELGEAGLLGLLLPAEFGGAGADRQTQVDVAETLARHGRSLGMVVAWQSQTTLASYLVDRLGSEAQRRRYLPQLASGEAILSVAISELGAGAHPKHLRTEATPVEGGWRLAGEKAYVTNGPVADLFVVLAITGVEGGRKRYSAFLVPRESDGLEFTEAGAVDYLRPALHCGLRLDGCFVPDDAILGPRDEGYPILAQPLRTAEDLMGLGTGLGAMAGSLDALSEEMAVTPDDELLEALGSLVALHAGARAVVRAAVGTYEREGDAAAIPLLMAGRQQVSEFQKRIASLQERAVPSPRDSLRVLLQDMARLGSAAGYVQRIRLRNLARASLEPGG